MRYKITADSTCDLPQELIEQYQIEIIPIYVQMGGKLYRDGVELQPDDIYAHVAQTGEMATTAAANLADYVRRFTALSEEYDFVIHISISSCLSSSAQNAQLAAADFENVYTFDSQSLSTAQGFLVLAAAELAAEGLAPEQIMLRLKETMEKVELTFVLDRLDYMKKGGRCSSVALLGANLLKLRPCIDMQDGKLAMAKKYRGTFSRCLEEYTAERLKDRTDLDLRCVFLTHSGVPEDILEQVRASILRYQPDAKIYESRASGTVSAHCGPGTLGVVVMRK